MKKIFYILDSNGEFYSTDRTKRYKKMPFFSVPSP